MFCRLVRRVLCLGVFGCLTIAHRMTRCVSNEPASDPLAWLLRHFRRFGARSALQLPTARRPALALPFQLLCAIRRAVLVRRIDFNGKADVPVLDDDARNLSAFDYVDRFALGGDCAQRVADFSLIQFGSHA